MVRKLQSKKSDNTGLPSRVARAIAKYKKLIPSIERMASFPAFNPNPVFEIDFSGKLAFLNKAAADTLKKIGDGKNIRAFFPSDIRDIKKKTRSKRKLQLVRKVRIKG